MKPIIVFLIAWFIVSLIMAFVSVYAFIKREYPNALLGSIFWGASVIISLIYILKLFI
jgi:asparagine N-glycosylation enzyme membrane subunit Stt3